MALHETVRRLAQEFSSDPNFGMYGSTEGQDIVGDLERALGVTIPSEVAAFIRSYGSIQFGTQCLDFVPNDYLPGCVEMTVELRERYPDAPDSLVMIHQDELVHYLLDTVSGRIHAWESFRPLIATEFYRTFTDFEEFLTYLADSNRGH